MDVTLALLADAANITDSGKLNMLGVFDRIMASNFPAVHPQMNLVVRLEAGPAERGQTKAFAVRLLGEDGESVLELSGEIQLDANPASLNTIVNQIITLNHVVFPNAGDYAFHILVNQETKRQVRLRVEQVTENPSPTAQP